ncbi:glycosyltransferase family 2 protein [Candidatus Stoquefichus massiliensis]|uniref:glycosyltransferase family 2 protein n=1 Tax=Candidatus Stoquefichus massiliensis TaxID=1470350 RepID=UPI000489ED0F|nr:glycosyltransferase family 2 protein [Candidatus Stoquefichus massiliensis]
MKESNNEVIPLVSIIIPTYDRPTMLDRTIQSVLTQTYKNIEIIIVDDNNPNTVSRKETEIIMSKYIDNHKIQYIKHKYNRNGSSARNTGWKHANGKYITFIDDDDEIKNSKIEKQVNCLEKNDEFGACYTGYKLIKSENKIQLSSEKRSGNLYLSALMRTLYLGSGSNLFLLKSIVDDIGGYDESFVRNQDIEFLVRVLEKTKLKYIDSIELIIHQENRSKERTFEELEEISKYYLKVFNERIDKLSIKDKRKVISVISLERFRIALYKRKIIKGFKILKDNHVSIKYIISYFFYLLNRIITKKSFGYEGIKK